MLLSRSFLSTKQMCPPRERSRFCGTRRFFGAYREQWRHGTQMFKRLESPSDVIFMNHNSLVTPTEKWKSVLYHENGMSSVKTCRDYGILRTIRDVGSHIMYYHTTCSVIASMMMAGRANNGEVGRPLCRSRWWVLRICTSFVDALRIIFIVISLSFLSALKNY